MLSREWEFCAFYVVCWTAYLKKLKADCPRIVRVYSTCIEHLSYPLPSDYRQYTSNAINATCDESIKDVSLHYMVHNGVGMNLLSFVVHRYLFTNSFGLPWNRYCDIFWSTRVYARHYLVYNVDVIWSRMLCIQFDCCLYTTVQNSIMDFQ